MFHGVFSFDHGMCSFLEKCSATMVDSKTSPSSLTVLASHSSDNAANALYGSSAPFSVLATPSADVSLTAIIHSSDTPMITKVFLEVSGISQFYYVFTSTSVTGTASEKQTTNPEAVNKIVVNLVVPVAANIVTIFMTPASPAVPVVVSSMYMVACYTPGKKILGLNIWSMMSGQKVDKMVE